MVKIKQINDGEKACNCCLSRRKDKGGLFAITMQTYGSTFTMVCCEGCLDDLTEEFEKSRKEIGVEFSSKPGKEMIDSQGRNVLKAQEENWDDDEDWDSE